METNIYETGDMVRVLEIKADASDLETDVRLAVKKFRTSVRIPGFRPGHIPVNLIRRRYAKNIEQYVVENLLKEVWEDFVDSNKQYTLVGKSKEVKREYALDQDLLIHVEFYVAPQIRLKDLSGQILRIPRFHISDQHIDFYIKKRLVSHIKPRPLTSLERIGDPQDGLFDQVTFQKFEVDQASDQMMIGGDSVQRHFFDYASYIDADQSENDKLRDLFKGKSVGDRVKIEKDGAQKQIHVPDSALSVYDVRIVEALRYDWPEIDDEWARRISRDDVDSADALQSWVKEYLEEEFHLVTLNLLEFALKRRMFDLHPFSLPDNYLEAFYNLEHTEIDGHNMALIRLSSNIQWDFMANAIEEDLKELPVPEEYDSKRMGIKLLDSVHPDRDEILNKLLSQFSLEYTDVPKDSRDYFHQVEYLTKTASKAPAP
ncbi:MAG: trigger factor [Bacteroidetes bacterium]|nr:trigger factor [Bacteroidota bacterium]MCY4224106.1 trigger factor [Bacteroidota bacterium]